AAVRRFAKGAGGGGMPRILSCAGRRPCWVAARYGPPRGACSLRRRERTRRIGGRVPLDRAGGTAARRSGGGHACRIGTERTHSFSTTCTPIWRLKRTS